MEYNFQETEKKWQKFWEENKIYQSEIDTSKPKYYVLDMFPYPSGAGLHVGHPLGYIASDIYARYMRLKGYNVLHPMGFDAFGLPAEQYAILTGKHPAKTTDENIKTYKKQLTKLGFSYDWNREVKTCDPAYYKWTQWAFIKMFNAWYNYNSNKAEHIDSLIDTFSKNGSKHLNAACSETINFSAQEWAQFSENKKSDILMNYRLAYISETMVNWCAELGVLANDEVKDGFSVRGGHTVERKLMKQWQLRITAYAERLLNDIENLDWTDSLKEQQRNWIGRSEGASIDFNLKNSNSKLKVFTTRPDTIFGATFMVIAPEHEIAEKITTAEFKNAVNDYISKAKNKTERERITEVNNISGVFTGSYAENPFNKKPIPVWIADYVLAGYGTGAIMAVPAHDSRDYDFAKHFKLPIIEVVSGGNISEESYDAKEGTLINSEFINGMQVKDAMQSVINAIEESEIGCRKINYRLRDAVFSRQRYWGEPFPIYYKNNIPHTISEDKLPLELPEMDSFKPSNTGEPPLANVKNWHTHEGYPYELSTMPGFAGSSAYYLRYMDPHNDNELVSKEAVNYWQNVDLYIGGAEHATGHLIYSRFWNKLLYDFGYICKDEPFQKLFNQGMILGRSNFVYRIKGENTFVSLNLKDNYNTTPIRVDINIVNDDILDIEAFKISRKEYNNASFILENNLYVCGFEIEKMSKTYLNVVNPDDIINQYGADTLRLYEMFLGPLDQSKPWDTKGIEGVFKFTKKLWRLFHDEQNNPCISNDKPTLSELKILHKTIKKFQDDIERFSFNTNVSSFMICINELTNLKCNKRDILKPLTILISSYIPHIAEELWHLLGNNNSVTKEIFPELKPEYLIENEFIYPVSFNGKMRFKVGFPSTHTPELIEKEILERQETIKWLEGKCPKKIIVVRGKIINIVC